MKRVTITDFNAGIVDAVDASLIADNACVEIENYEYRDLTGLKKRKDMSFSEINDSGLTDVKSFCIWYPPKMPSGATGERIIVAHTGTTIVAVYEAGLWSTVPLFSTTSESVRFYAGYDRVLIADGVNPGRYLSINKDDELEFNDLGLKSPLSLLSLSDGDETYAEVGQEDIGMGVERGNILQYCYTVEDKYGNESNPSPISTIESLCKKYPDADSPLGYKYYYKGVVVTGFSLSGYTSEQIKNLEKFNLYRRDVEFNSGTIYTQFGLVKQANIDSSSVNDSQADSLRDISYGNAPAPASQSIIEKAGVIYVGGVRSPAVKFPFTWDKYVEIGIANDNGIDYCNTVIGFVLDYAELDLGDWDSYLADDTKIRLFFSDLTTPLPVVCKVNGTKLLIYARVPWVNRNSTLKLYLTVADSGYGVARTIWDDYAYGKFFDFEDGNLDWSHQRVFLLPKVEGIGTSINVLATKEEFYRRLPNVADALSIDESVSVIGQTFTSGGGNIATVFEARKTLSNISVQSYSAQIEIDAVRGVRDKSIFYISGITGSADADIFEVGNLIISYDHSERRLSIELGADSRVLSPPVSGNTRFELAVYVNGKAITSKLRVNNYVNSMIGSFTTPDFLPGIAGVGVRLSYIHNIRVAYVGELNASQADRALTSYMRLMPYHPIKIGSDLAADVSTWETSDITAEAKKFSLDERLNIVQWSGVGKDNIPVLNFKRFKENVLAITDAPSFLKQQYQNTIIVFTRNSVNRIPLTDDLAAMAGSVNVIEELKSAGLYAPDSLVSSGNSFYWLSEIGVIKWSPDGLQNLSRGKKNIPLGMNYIGVWVANNSQYLLHNRDTDITYVYHEMNDAWTEFTGLYIKDRAYLNLGADLDNKVLIYDGENFVEYPSNSESGQVTYKIATKKFLLDNLKPHRYRVKYKNGTSCDIDAVTFNHYQGGDEILAERNNAPRFEWILLPNGFWGEYIQFVFNNVTDLTQIDLDIREGI